jgi:hypothetical protein
VQEAIFGMGHSQPPFGTPVTRQPWLEEAQARQSEIGLQDVVGPVIWLASLQSAHGRCGHSIMPNLERALINPAGVFGSPDEVVLHPLLSLACKREILGRWAWDELLIEIAHSEGMPGGPPSRLGDVKEALRRLGDEWHPRPSAPAARVLRYDLDPRLALAA